MADMSESKAAGSAELHPSMADYLEKTLDAHSGLQAIVVSNSYGNALLTVRSREHADVDTTHVERMFSSVFALASDQAEKLPFGTTKSNIAFFEHMTLVQVDACPLVVSLMALPDANVGTLMALVPQLQRALEPIRKKADLELA